MTRYFSLFSSSIKNHLSLLYFIFYILFFVLYVLLLITFYLLNFRYMTTMGEGWTAFRLQRLGQWNEANTQVFPRTTEIIRGLNIPLAVRGVMFAKQVNSTD